MVRNEKFDVLDRNNMDVILKEQQFQQTGCTESSCAVEVGKIFNTQYMNYGAAVFISGDGQSMLAGASGVDVPAAQAGRAYVYKE
jgi:uncharacterized protein YycO